VQPEAEKRAEKLLQLEGVNSSYAVIHADPGHYAKVWDAGSFYSVASHISGDKDMVCLFVGTGCENSIVRQVVPHLGGKARDLSGKTDLATLIAIIRNASFFIGVDSAPAHIAAAFKVPGVVLFSGVNDPVEWAPRG
jgi:ADP-heptose:LPS heptosyltransferase